MDRSDRPNALLTGRPGTGKTTAIRKTLERLADVRLGGCITSAIEDRGHRTGFTIADIRGPSGTLASVDLPRGPRVSRFRVNVPDIERIGVPALEWALAEADVIVCDEIGRMELFCPRFCEVILQCLDSPKPLIGTLQARHNEFLDQIRTRDDVDIITVTRDNRDALPASLAARLRRALER